LKNLPSKTVNSFNNLILFGAYNAVGDLDPWAALPDDTIAQMWNQVFSDTYPISIYDGEDGDHSLFIVVKRLVSSSLACFGHLFVINICQVFCGISSHISNRLGEAAVTALEDEYNRCELSSPEDRATFVINMLGKENESNRPFLWHTTDDVTWQGARDNLKVRVS
jgi:hypothetical protein